MMAKISHIKTSYYVYSTYIKKTQNKHYDTIVEQLINIKENIRQIKTIVRLEVNAIYRHT